MGSDVVAVPGWVKVDRIQVRDLRAIASAGRSELARGCLDAVDWILDPHGPTALQAQAEAAATGKHRDDYHRGISDTLAWLCGWIPDPRLEIPRRNTDGSIVTPEQRYEQIIAKFPPGTELTPERRYEARNQAEADYARWLRLAGYR